MSYKKPKKVTDIWSGKKSSPKHTSCWAKHPTYLINDMPIIGGSCTSQYPKVDVYIGLDHGARTGERNYPWNDGVDIYFPITDMGVPKDLAEFKQLLSYTAKAMKEGKTVFVGCIGGHGRTGLFLAALTKFITGDKNATATVRANYCKKAVESKKQVDWLYANFGIKKIKETKADISWDSKWDKQDSFGNTIKNAPSFSDVPWGQEESAKDHVKLGKVTEGKKHHYMYVEGASIISNKS